MPIRSKESTPPPTIGKIGPYTVFVTPPSTPSPRPSAPHSQSPANKVPSPLVQPRTPLVQRPLPPVQAPPQQFQKPAPSDGSAFGFIWNAVTKVQNAHSSLDEYLAHWFGLNQSKYQWALDDYYESKGVDQVDGKAKDISSKVQTV